MPPYLISNICLYSSSLGLLETLRQASKLKIPKLLVITTLDHIKKGMESLSNRVARGFRTAASGKGGKIKFWEQWAEIHKHAQTIELKFIYKADDVSTMKYADEVAAAHALGTA